MIQAQSLAESLNAPLSMSHSAGVLGGYGLRADWIRPGIMLYGVNPLVSESVNKSPSPLVGEESPAQLDGVGGTIKDLSPVMTLTSRLIRVNTLKKGDTVGYGGGVDSTGNHASGGRCYRLW